MLLLSWLSLIAVGLWQFQVQAQPVELPVPASEDSEVGRALYDQRQTGKYNIHVSIKDVAIIEVDQNELADESYNAEDDDYYYDDNALTIKPIKFTTEGSTTSTKQAATAAAAASTTVPVPAPSTTTKTTTTTTTLQPSAVVVLPVTAATVAVRNSNSNSYSNNSSNSSKISSYSAQLLADIAATQRQRPKTNNLIIMNGSTAESLPQWQQARSKHEPITTTTTTSSRTTTAAAAAVPTALRAGLTDNIEYTPPQGHNSPIFKVKVQRTANEHPTDSPTQCRAHQYRDAHGKCRTKRSGSVLRKLFSMLVSLPFASHRRAGHGLGHGLQVSP